MRPEAQGYRSPRDATGDASVKAIATGALSSGRRAAAMRLSTIAVTIHFAFDSAAILPQAMTNMQSLRRALASPEFAPFQIRIERLADSTGPSAHNLDLSRRRADSVKQYLVQHFDIGADRLLTKGRGEQEPIATNAARVDRNKNQHTEFVNVGAVASSQ